MQIKQGIQPLFFIFIENIANLQMKQRTGMHHMKRQSSVKTNTFRIHEKGILAYTNSQISYNKQANQKKKSSSEYRIAIQIYLKIQVQ